MNQLDIVINELIDNLVATYLRGKTDSQIASLDQDDIDGYIIPIMEKIENGVDNRLSEAISKAFSKSTAGVNANWWEQED